MSRRGGTSGRDRVDEAFAAWRADTEAAAPPARLVDEVVRAALARPPSLLGPLVQLGRHALWSVALAAALLAFAAVRSVHALEEQAAAAVMRLDP